MLPLWRFRMAKREARAKKRCAVRGHRFMFTWGWTQINGKTVQSDSGNICACGRYEKITEHVYSLTD